MLFCNDFIYTLSQTREDMQSEKIMKSHEKIRLGHEKLKEALKNHKKANTKDF